MVQDIILSLWLKRVEQTTGIDFAPNMIRLAQETAKAKNMAHACNFVTGDFLQYEFNQKFDFIFAAGVHDYIPPALQV